jgi:SAM-dependent methyltransferase
LPITQWPLSWSSELATTNSKLIQWDNYLTSDANLKEHHYHECIQLHEDRFDSIDKWKARVQDGRLGFLKLLRKGNIQFQGTILELGAGMCWFSAELSKLEEVQEIFALEFSEKSLDVIAPHIIAYLNASANKITRVLGDWNNLRFPDGIFDFVVCSQALHHMTNPVRSLREVRRVLKEDGKLVAIMEPMLPRWRPDKLKNHAKRERDLGITENLWSKEEWITFFREAGFIVDFSCGILGRTWRGKLARFSPLRLLNGYLFSNFIITAERYR